MTSTRWLKIADSTLCTVGVYCPESFRSATDSLKAQADVATPRRVSNQPSRVSNKPNKHPQPNPRPPLPPKTRREKPSPSRPPVSSFLPSCSDTLCRKIVAAFRHGMGFFLLHRTGGNARPILGNAGSTVPAIDWNFI